jgi:ATP-binding cassette subfamily B protein
VQPEIADSPYALDPPRQIESVELKDVGFGYRDLSLAVEGVSFRAEQGQLVALVGPSGSGKSTLINLLCRLYDPAQGQILFNGRDIKSFKLAGLRSLISIVPQDNILFGLSVRENIAIGLASADEAQIQEAAKLAGCHEFIINLPDQYNTVLAERGATLSGGQQRRIAIARAALRQTPILILDEPLAGLDADNRRMVNDAICKLKLNRITFMIVHDLDAARDADLLICMARGSVAEQGTHQQLLERRGVYFQMVSSC